MKRLSSFVFALWLGLTALMMQSSVLAAGKLEHHQITSTVLGNVGEVSQRELSVYLPEGYETSEQDYPVVYLVHGATGTNRTFLAVGYGELISGIHVNLIVDKLIEDGAIKPLIVVLPNLSRELGRQLAPYDEYFVKEIVPFVDATYRTIPERGSRAISGHSQGGHDSINIAFSFPELFSLVGGYASGSPGGPGMPGRNIIEAHNQEALPLRFWIYAGKNDDFGLLPLSSAFVNLLKEFGIPHEYHEDDGDHYNRVAQRVEDSIIFFAKHFVYSSVTAVQPHGKLATTEGQIKVNRNFVR